MPNRTSWLHERRVWWAVALLAGALLRLWFLRHPMPPDEDTGVYAELAGNLFHHGVYGLAADGAIVPTLIRLPGYPIFLGLVFALLGAGNLTAALLVQIVLDLLGCWLIASFVREQVSARAGTVAIYAAGLCPFTAAYAAMPLTECLSVFAVSLALWASGRLLRGVVAGVWDGRATAWTACGMALAMLLRPDGVLLGMALVAALAWYGVRLGQLKLALRVAVVCVLLAVVPLVPWAARNWRTFGVVQPLAPRRVNDPGEYVTYGVYAWMRTWAVDVVSTGNVFWKLGTETIEVQDLPARAFGSDVERRKTAALLAEYNVGRAVTPALDAKFAALARERVRAHPGLCLIWVPLLRVGDMWLRPRTETLGLDADWWRFERHQDESLGAVGLGLLNLLLVGAALVSALRGQVRWVALPVVYVALRCLLLSTMENSEPRYTLEAFPLAIACAACLWSRSEDRQQSSMPDVADTTVATRA